MQRVKNNWKPLCCLTSWYERATIPFHSLVVSPPPLTPNWHFRTHLTRFTMHISSVGTETNRKKYSSCTQILAVSLGWNPFNSFSANIILSFMIFLKNKTKSVEIPVINARTSLPFTTGISSLVTFCWLLTLWKVAKMRQICDWNDKGTEPNMSCFWGCNFNQWGITVSG